MAQIVDLRSKGHLNGKRWQVDYRNNLGRRTRRSFHLKREAEAYLSEVNAALNKGVYVDPSRGVKTTVSDLWDEYRVRLQTVGAAGQGATSEKTLYTYQRQWENYIQPRWGDTRLSGIHYEDVAEWIGSLQSVRGQAGGAPALAGAETKKAVGGLFSRMLDFAVTRRYLVRNPAEDASGRAPHIPGKREVGRTKRLHVFLTMPDLVSIADQCGEFRDLILFTGTCGLRWGEVSALQVQDVKLGDRPVIHVQRAFKDVGGQLTAGPTKSGENRKVPVPPSIAPLLARRIDGRSRDALVFTAPGGGPLRNSNFTKRYYAPAIEAAAQSSDDPSSFPQPTFHDLRHTAVSLAISHGANVKVVQRIAGHADATMTLNTYAGLFDEDLFDSARRIDAALTAVMSPQD